MPERVGAVVVTYNRKACLRRCVQALLAQTRPLQTILVIDNASTDGTAALVEAEFPTVILQRLPANTGGAGGFAEGLRLALEHGCDWVWLMDDDVVPYPNALHRLFEPGLHEQADTVALASVKLAPDGRHQAAHLTWYSLLRMRHVPVPIPPGETEPQRIGHSSFVSLLIPRWAIEAAGWPRSDFFIFHDDAEYCLRLRTMGPLYAVPQSKVVHGLPAPDDPKRTPARRPWQLFWRRYYLLRNSLLMLQAHEPRWGRRAIGYGAVLLRALRMAAPILVEDRKRARWQVIVQALYDGIRGRSGKRIDPENFLE